MKKWLILLFTGILIIFTISFCALASCLVQFYGREIAVVMTIYILFLTICALGLICIIIDYHRNKF